MSFFPYSSLFHLGFFSSSCSAPLGSSCYIQAPSQTDPIPLSPSPPPKRSLSGHFLIPRHISFFPRLNQSRWERRLRELFCLFPLRYFLLQEAGPDPSEVFISGTLVTTFAISPGTLSRRKCTSGYSCSHIHPLLLQK